MSEFDDVVTFPHSDNFRMIINVFFPTVMVIGVLGNVMVIMVILSTKEMRNSTNIFLANLAIADLMTLLIWGSGELFDVNSKHMHMEDQGEGICKALEFMKDAVAYVSVLTILAIGFERYYAICQPLKAVYICTKKRACGICLLVWALATLSSSPQLLFRGYGLDCYYVVPDLFFNTYDVISGFLMTFLPLIILVILFLIIFRNLRQALAPSVNAAATRHRRHVITMLVAIVLCFFLGHLPYRILLILEALNPEYLSVVTYDYWLSFGRGMVFLHSAINPILYSFMSERFRAGFKYIIYDTVHKPYSWCGNCCVRRGVTNRTTTLMIIPPNLDLF